MNHMIAIDIFSSMVLYSRNIKQVKHSTTQQINRLNNAQEANIAYYRSST